MPINCFDGKYFFLSNFDMCYLKTPEGRVYPSVEHAFQSFKTTDPEWEFTISHAGTPGKAKRLGKECPLRPDWDEVKVEVMTRFLEYKFANPLYRDLLLATGDEELIEGNQWHDNFWGICNCPDCEGGQNMLGKLLMELRSKIKNQK